jgi:hypothetical protein
MRYFYGFQRTTRGLPVRARVVINSSAKVHEEHFITGYAFGVTHLAAVDLAKKLFLCKYKDRKELDRLKKQPHPVMAGGKKGIPW